MALDGEFLGSEGRAGAWLAAPPGPVGFLVLGASLGGGAGGALFVTLFGWGPLGGVMLYRAGPALLGLGGVLMWCVLIASLERIRAALPWWAFTLTSLGWLVVGMLTVFWEGRDV